MQTSQMVSAMDPSSFTRREVRQVYTHPVAITRNANQMVVFDTRSAPIIVTYDGSIQPTDIARHAGGCNARTGYDDTHSFGLNGNAVFAVLDLGLEEDRARLAGVLTGTMVNSPAAQHETSEYLLGLGSRATGLETRIADLRAQSQGPDHLKVRDELVGLDIVLQATKAAIAKLKQPAMN